MRLVRLCLSGLYKSTVELNDPFNFNAQRFGLLTALRTVIRKLESLASTGEVYSHIFQGAGAHFCTGGRHDDLEHVTVDERTALAGLPKQSSITKYIRLLRVHTSASIHGKLLGGGVAFALSADWCACSIATTFNFGNLPRGVNPIFMLSRALPLTVGYPTSY